MSKHDMTSIGTYIKMVTFTITIKRFFTPKNKTKKKSEINYQKAESMYYNLLSTIICLVHV